MAEIQFNGNQWEVSEALQAFYIPYASYVIQTRALPDARDGLKTGARFILYAQFKDKLTCKEKKRKAVATINAAMRFSPHGDASILGTAVRMSQDFSLRYPVIEVQGNNGSYLSGDDYSQSRYLEMRGNEIAWEMTELLNKDTIDTWKLNYTEEEYYPTVLPSKFPYGLVNGNFGIGVACASSIPPHNIVDVCNAAQLLISKPEATFEELYCPIDFPTGGTIINEEEVKESLKNGDGRAALVRATIDYDEKNNELIVTEIPYMTFTNTIISSINKAIDEGLLPTIETVIDSTDFEGVKICIQLKKNTNVQQTLKRLYKYTCLQNSYTIKMNMLENGKVPKLFTWKEAIQAYLDHLENITVKSYNFDLKKLSERLEIVLGLTKACSNIEKTIEIIKKSNSVQQAKIDLIDFFELSEVQAESILKLRLASLNHLEVDKLEKEVEEKRRQIAEIKEILSDEKKIHAIMIEDLEKIKQKYGDKRRTTNINLNFTEEEEPEPIEEKELLIYYTNLGNLYTVENSTLLTSRRGTKGTKIKLKNDEFITETISNNNSGKLLAFSSLGRMYSVQLTELPVNGKININQLFSLRDDEKITSLTTFLKYKEVDYLCFITEKGYIKKTSVKEYDMRRGKSIQAIKLTENDKVVTVLFIKKEPIGILTKKGFFVIIDTEKVNAIGRNSIGVKGISLSDGDYVISSHVAEGKYLVTISEKGLIKKTSVAEFPICSRGIKGRKISGTKDDDFITDFLYIFDDCNVLLASEEKSLKINTSELRELSRTAIGVKGFNTEKVMKIIAV